MTAHRKIIEPSIEPVTLAEAKTHLRIEHTADDTYIEGLIQAAREYVEQETNRVLITQTWEYYLDDLGVNQNTEWWDGTRELATTVLQKRCIELPLGPVQSITSVKTFDEEDNETVFDSSKYFLDVASLPARLALRRNQNWDTFTRETNGFQVTYVAGYGDNASDVLRALRHAILILVATWYENREVTTENGLTGMVPEGVSPILEKYKVWTL